MFWILSLVLLAGLSILIVYNRQSVFNIVVYETIHADRIFNYRSSKKIFRLKPKVRSKINAVLTMADPFLFVYKDELFMFYEEKSELNNGIIKGFKTQDLKNWTDLGVILSETCHLSFPFIFEFDNEVYLMPETFDKMSLSLYRFENFPYGCTWSRELMSGPHFIDSHIYKQHDLFYLFSNKSDDELCLYYSTDLMNWTQHPKSPIVEGNKYARSGGGIVSVRDKYYRIAQDTSNIYGDNFHVFELKKLTVDDYEESLLLENVIKKDLNWNAEGGHHFHSVFFNGRYITVFDGKKRVSYIEKISYPFFRFFQKLAEK